MQKKRALISVSNKDHLPELAHALVKHDYEIISTGGTKTFLENHQIPVLGVESVTHFPEILDGRVKTLHPLIHGGLLARRNDPAHAQQVQVNGINYIDMVVVNLYPFVETINKPNVQLSDAIENIDIGGPSMIRSAAKNYQDVVVLTNPHDYREIITELNSTNTISLATKAKLASKAFQLTAYYDAHIANFFNVQNNITVPATITLPYQLHPTEMRYGENPHQSAAFYYDENRALSLSQAEQLQGKQLSYNNIQDTNAAIQIVAEFNDPVLVGLKHMNPCGFGKGKTVEEAWDNCYNGDPVSIFGGIVATNQTIDEVTALKMNKIFLEIVLAPSFTPSALTTFAKKKNLRVLKLDFQNRHNRSQWQYVSVNGGLLRQEWDLKNIDDCPITYPTKRKPTTSQMQDLVMGQKIVKHVKSNAIVIVKDQQLIGVGAGQMNRVGAAKIALEWCKNRSQGAILASDAFFPFDDVVDLAHAYGITAIVQPGGSIRDHDSVRKCDDLDIAMIFTGMRHFKH